MLQITDLTEEQIKKAALNLIKQIFKEQAEPEEIRISELNIIIIYQKDTNGKGMEPYFLENGGEFVYSWGTNGKLAIVNIYTLDALKDYL